jgi:hypothetical protein
MGKGQTNSENSVYLKDIAEDFCESIKIEPVLLDAIERIMTGYYKVSKQIAKEKLRPLILQDKRIVTKVVALEGRGESNYLHARHWIYHVEADDDVMLDRILELHEQYRSES